MDEDLLSGDANERNHDRRLFALLLTPSIFSGMVAVLTSLLVVGGIAIITNYQGSSFQQDILGFQYRMTSEDAMNASVTDEYAEINSGLAGNDIVSNLPVMAFWMFVGVLVYFVVTGLIQAITTAADVEQELHHVHVRRKELLRELLIKTMLRLGALILWLLYIVLFSKIITPYVLAAAHVGGGNITSLNGMPYSLLALLIMSLALHIHVVLLRLVVLRPRIFSMETSF